MKKSFLFYVLMLWSLPFITGQSQIKIAKTHAIADINQLIKNLETVHYNPYLNLSKKIFLLKKDSILQTWTTNDSISIAQFTLDVMKITAFVSNGHTSVDWQNPNLFPALSKHQFLPFKVKLNTANELVVTHSSSSQIKAGEKIKQINQIGANDLYEDALRCHGGIRNFRNEFGELFFPLYLFLKKMQAPYAIQLTDGQLIPLEKGIGLNQLGDLINSNNPQAPYTFDILDKDIGYIAYNSCENPAAFEQFLRTTFQTIKAEKIKKLIIDIRRNSGGNSSLNDLLIHYISRKKYRQASGRYWKVSQAMKDQLTDSLYIQAFGKAFIEEYLNTPNQSIIESFDDKLTKPKRIKNRFRGKSCILISPYTFSSANMLADAVATYHLSTLIGQATGEYTNDFGEILTIQLPHSKAYLQIATTYDIGAAGNPKTLHTVQPDIMVEKNVLAFAKKWLRQKK